MVKSGLRASVFDCSMLRHKNMDVADVTAEEIARAGQANLDDFVKHKDRSFGTSAMGRGLGFVLKKLVESSELDGVIAVGGAQGTSISSHAFRELPIGFPKLIVSVIASGNIRPFIGESDTLIMFSVADINGGINEITRTILTNAGAAIAGMVSNGTRMSPLLRDRPIVGITTWGTTQKAVTSASEELRSAGYETVMFHSSGACTSAMEDLVEQGMIDGVLDLTTHDLLGEVFPGTDIMPPTRPGRLESAARRGIPLIVAPGGLNMFVMGPFAELATKYTSRPTIAHNPSITEVKLTREEMLAVARVLAERLNAAKGFCAFLLPLRGWNDYDAEGMGNFYVPEDNKAFLAAFRKLLRPGIEIHELDCNLNDEKFGKFAAKLLMEQLPIGKK
jgi:uncharacterized protein (UPF0261 family)